MLFLIVGPSGSGKDTLIDFVCNHLPIKRVKRFITREPNEFEDFISVSKNEFDTMDFMLKWSAHNKSYGVPWVDFNNEHFIINGSRSIVNEARDLGAVIIGLTTNPLILRERLIKRGRDPLSEVKQRINRVIDFKPDFLVDTSSSDISIAGLKLVNFLKKQILNN